MRITKRITKKSRGVQSTAAARRGGRPLTGRPGGSSYGSRFGKRGGKARAGTCAESRRASVGARAGRGAQGAGYSEGSMPGRVAPKKALSQHFLKSFSVRQEVLNALDDFAGEVIVEIGAGTGALTTGLAGIAAKVIAVEVDPELVRLLRKAVTSLPNADVLQSNILDVDLRRVAAEYECDKLSVVGSLPYHMTTRILLYVLEHRDVISRAVVMVQKEYADRLLAAPGGREYGAITLRVAYYAGVTKVTDVPSSAFHPRPKVDSTVVMLVFRDTPAVRTADENYLFKVIRETFNHRRKMLVNTLSALSGLVKEETKEVCLSVGIDPARRPETLSLEDFARLADALRSAVSERKREGAPPKRNLSALGGMGASSG